MLPIQHAQSILENQEDILVLNISSLLVTRVIRQCTLISYG